jgi:hypothetical protein
MLAVPLIGPELNYPRDSAVSSDKELKRPAKFKYLRGLPCLPGFLFFSSDKRFPSCQSALVVPLCGPAQPYLEIRSAHSEDTCGMRTPGNLWARRRSATRYAKDAIA